MTLECADCGMWFRRPNLYQARIALAEHIRWKHGVKIKAESIRPDLS